MGLLHLLSTRLFLGPPYKNGVTAPRFRFVLNRSSRVRDGKKDNIMNKYIEEYIKQRKNEIAEDERLTKEAEKAEVLSKLHVGVKEYYKDFPNEPADNFPFYDSAQQQHYRYNIGDVTDEEYAELLKYVPPAQKSKTNNKAENLLDIASSVVLYSGVIGFIVFFILSWAPQESYHDWFRDFSWRSFAYGIVLFILGFVNSALMQVIRNISLKLDK